MPTRVMEGKPSDFRLGKKPNGEVVLLGAFKWIDYNDPGVPIKSGVEWKKLYTVPLDEDGTLPPGLQELL